MARFLWQRELQSVYSFYLWKTSTLEKQAICVGNTKNVDLLPPNNTQAMKYTPVTFQLNK